MHKLTYVKALMKNALKHKMFFLIFLTISSTYILLLSSYTIMANVNRPPVNNWLGSHLDQLQICFYCTDPPARPLKVEKRYPTLLSHPTVCK